MTLPHIRLTWLYAPGDRPELFAKAVRSGADVVILDLEDSVTPARKSFSREAVHDFLQAEHEIPVHVRINDQHTSWSALDLVALENAPGLAGLRVPKVESPVALTELLARLQGKPPELHLLIESARGVEEAFEIATASDAVSGISLGEADLRSELGLGSDGGAGAGLAWARGRIVIAARAAGLPHPPMSVYPQLDDDAGLEASCRAGRAMGFLGRAAIHPTQLPIIERAFRPYSEEVTQAEELLAGLDDAADAGKGVHVLNDGRFADRAMVESARLILALASRTKRP